MRSGNPALNERAFRGTAVLDRPAGAPPPAGYAPPPAPPYAPPAAGRMTVEGTVYKTALLMLLCLGTAALVWGPAAEGQVGVPGGALAFFLLLGLGIATGLRPRIAVVTGPIYAIVSGAFLGTIASVFEQAYPGIAIQAALGTILTLGGMLVAYRTGLIRATPTFIKVVVSATLGIVLLYVVSIVLRLFGSGMPLLHDTGPLGILLSVGIVIVAALNLVLDFHLIETYARSGAEARLEWYGAFALLVTLVWLYLELLRMLAKLRE